MRRESRFAWLSGVLLALGIVGATGPVLAAEPAADAPKKAAAKGASKASGPSAVAAAPESVSSSEEKARTAFESFTREWMQKMQASTATRSTGPEANGGVRFSRYASDFTTELRATGSETAPFVGLLRYREDQMACKDVAATQCEVESATNVTEIFRWQGGRWIY